MKGKGLTDDVRLVVKKVCERSSKEKEKYRVAGRWSRLRLPFKVLVSGQGAHKVSAFVDGEGRWSFQLGYDVQYKVMAVKVEPFVRLGESKSPAFSFGGFQATSSH